MTPARRSIGWTCASPRGLILPWVVTGFLVGCRDDTLDAKLKKSIWLRFSATIALCKLFFRGKVNCPWWRLG